MPFVYIIVINYIVGGIKMAVLVTGGCGFIGRFLVRELAKRGVDEIRVVDINTDGKLEAELPDVSFQELDVNLLNTSHWEHLLEGVDTVYHLGGLLGTSELFSRVIEAERVNVLGTLNLLEAMRKHHVQKIVFVSKPNMWKHNVYTITKENCERYLSMYHEIYGIKPIIIRPFNVYGPEEKVEQYRKAVPYFVLSALKDEPIEVFGNGEQTMDLIHVRDCVEAFVISANNPGAIGKTIEIGSGREVTVNRLAELIIKLAESKSEIKHIPMRKGEVANSKIEANIKDMKEILKYELTITLEEGLTDTIEHYRNNLDRYEVYQFHESEIA
ncbi:NAD-dependent epimerase/dehydratase family protein [Chloroflexota bacterium]